MIKVSIIIPVYNTANYLNRCLDSVVNQTLKDIEILCINDGSTDNSAEILTKYANKYHNIIYINLNKNQGVAVARNIALRYAKGEFIGFVDSDDYIDLNYFENLYLQSNGYDIIRGIRLIDKKFVKNKPYGCLVPSIIRRSFIIKNKLRFPNKKTGEDSTFKRWLYQKTSKILEVKDNNIYYYYERRNGSLSNYQLGEKE